MRALIAMSGGVDSSAAAQLMIDRGYECVGCTMRLFSDNSTESNTGDAGGVCAKIGIPYHIFSCENEFKQAVVEPFVSSYLHGCTPNPCIECNRCLKFCFLIGKMRELECGCLATGHYARIGRDGKTGIYTLHKAADPSKDQSYVLYTLTQEQLSCIQFPLGDLDKQTVRAIAAASGFRNADRKESQDICFVPDGDYAGFIGRFTAADYDGTAVVQEKTVSSQGFNEGNFIDREGGVLGRHKGIIHYTLGQRRGLGIPSAHRLYVTDINPADNTVTLGTNEDLFRRELTARRINLISGQRIEGELRAAAKIRYRHQEQPCTVTQPEEDMLRVVFDEPQRAITPGQSVVLYDGDRVIGGGIIQK